MGALRVPDVSARQADAGGSPPKGSRVALSALDKPVQKRDMPSLTSLVARMYADKTYKTLTRDLNWLVGADLIERESEGYRVRMEQMKAFWAGRV